MGDISTNTLIIMITVVTSVFAILTSLLMFLFRERRERRYDEELNRAQLEMLRASLEKQIYGLTDRLMTTEERWRDLNHLLISSQKASAELLAKPHKAALTEFLKSAGVTEADLTIDKDLVFVLTPFHPDYRETFEAIASICQDTGLKCLRGDEENVAGDILHHILRLLARARVVVANVDGRNPNVFYELGIAHAMDKGTILISRSIEQLPFDVKARRIVIYDDLADLQLKLRDEFIKVLART